ncbi:MAG: cytochrome ubiquinol oxidase subunit I [Phycisphaerales bacterium JB038]
MDVELLSRIQFAITVMFHYLFPPLTIGMGIVMVYLEAMFLRTREPIYEAAARFWTQLFAVSFAVGVATGIVMEFQFGTNWAAYSRFVGDVFGAALAAEGIFAFFLESGFLAVLVFGWDKVSPRFHFFATLMVALGSIFSALWIIVANSWQQTPEGHHYVQVLRDGAPWVVDGLPVIRAEVESFWAVVFNPSTIDRFVHTIIGAFLMGSFFIMSISAYYILRGKHLEFAKRSFTGALILGTIFSLVQLASGHSNADMVAEHQPAKLAAFEGHFETGPADLSLIGLPDREQEETILNIGIPGGVSFLVDWNFESQVLGLKAFPKEDWPPLVITFASYHIMVGLGMFFILITLIGSYFRWRGTLFEKRWLMRAFMGCVILAVVANQLGWVAAEVGRQPWVVQAPILRDAQGDPLLNEQGQVIYETVQIEGMPAEANMIAGMRTSEAVSGSVSGGEVLGSIIMFSLIYLLLGGIWLYVLDHKIKVGPMPAPEPSGDAGTQEVNHGS